MGRFPQLLEGARHQMGEAAAAWLLQEASMWQVLIERLAQQATNFQPDGPIHNYEDPCT